MQLGPLGQPVLPGVTGATGAIGATGTTGPVASLITSGAAIYTAVQRLNITGSILTNLPSSQVTTFIGFQYIPEDGSLIIPKDGFYLYHGFFHHFLSK